MTRKQKIEAVVIGHLDPKKVLDALARVIGEAQGVEYRRVQSESDIALKAGCSDNPSTATASPSDWDEK